jgi:hypothetical protein
MISSVMPGARLATTKSASRRAIRSDRFREERPAAAQARLRRGGKTHPSGAAFAATGGKKPSFTTDQRRRLATVDKQLSSEERRKCCHLVKPATILAWFRQFAARKYDSSNARRGRPAKQKDVEMRRA